MLGSSLRFHVPVLIFFLSLPFLWFLVRFVRGRNHYPLPYTHLCGYACKNRDNWLNKVFELDVILAGCPKNVDHCTKPIDKHSKGGNNQSQIITCSITYKFNLSHHIKLHYHIFNKIMDI